MTRTGLRHRYTEGGRICTTVRVRCTSTSAVAVKRFWFSCSTEATLRIAGLRNRPRSGCAWKAVLAFANCGRAVAHVRAAMCHNQLGADAKVAPLFEDFVGSREQCSRHFEAERFGGLDVEHGFVFRRSLHREVGWFLAFQDAVVSVASNCTGASDKVAITAAWRASRRPGTGQQRRARRLGLQS